jgi:hypothetical protein
MNDCDTYSIILSVVQIKKRSEVRRLLETIKSSFNFFTIQILFSLLHSEGVINTNFHSKVELCKQYNKHMSFILKNVNKQFWGAAFLLSLIFERTPTKKHSEIIRELFEKGDVNEQITLIRLLSTFHNPVVYRNTAQLALKSNVVDVFHSLAINNTYPSMYLSSHDFQNLVLKAISLSLNINQITNLSNRINTPLKNKIGDYILEQKSSMRPVAKNLDIILNHKTQKKGDL